jgi:hypothetical protein
MYKGVKESATNKIEELKAENYNLKQEITSLKNKINNSNNSNSIYQEKNSFNSKKVQAS